MVLQSWHAPVLILVQILPNSNMRLSATCTYYHYYYPLISFSYYIDKYTFDLGVDHWSRGGGRRKSSKRKLRDPSPEKMKDTLYTKVAPIYFSNILSPFWAWLIIPLRWTPIRGKSGSRENGPKAKKIELDKIRQAKKGNKNIWKMNWGLLQIKHPRLAEILHPMGSQEVTS